MTTQLKSWSHQEGTTPFTAGCDRAQTLALLPATQIINGYGPTESTTFACCYHVPKRLDKTVSSIPLGRPIANTEVYLLDGSLCPVPVGVPGELYIGGQAWLGAISTVPN